MPPLASWQCSSCTSRGLGSSCCGVAGRDVRGVTSDGRCCCRSETGDEPVEVDPEGDIVSCVFGERLPLTDVLWSLDGTRSLFVVVADGCLVWLYKGARILIGYKARVCACCGTSKMLLLRTMADARQKCGAIKTDGALVREVMRLLL